MNVLNITLATALVACIPFAILWWQRNHPKWARDAKPAITVLASRAFGPRRSVAIVEVEGERLLLGVTDQNIGLIKSLPAFGQTLSRISDSENQS